MKPQTSAETKYLSLKALKDVNTLIKLLCAIYTVSFLLLKLVFRVMKLPE